MQCGCGRRSTGDKPVFFHLWLYSFMVIAGGVLFAHSEGYAQTPTPDFTEQVKPQVFLGDKAFPETKLSIQGNFVEFRFVDASQHPLIRRLLPLAEAAVSRYLKPNSNGQTQAFADFGLKISEIESLHSIPFVDVRQSEDPNAERPNSLSLGAKDLYLRSQKEIQWPGLLRSLPLESFGFQPEQVDAWVDQTIAGRELLLHRASESTDVSSDEALNQMRLAYELVAGGFATAVLNVPKPVSGAPQDIVDSPGEEISRLANQIKQIAVGIDHDRNSTDLVLHAVLVVQDGNTVDDALRTVLDLQKFLIASESKEDSEVTRMRWWSEAKIRPDEMPGLGAFINVELRFQSAELLSVFF